MRAPAQSRALNSIPHTRSMWLTCGCGDVRRTVEFECNEIGDDSTIVDNAVSAPISRRQPSRATPETTPHRLTPQVLVPHNAQPQGIVLKRVVVGKRCTLQRGCQVQQATIGDEVELSALSAPMNGQLLTAGVRLQSFEHSLVGETWHLFAPRASQVWQGYPCERVAAVTRR